MNMFVQFAGILFSVTLLMMSPSCLSSNVKDTWSRHDDALIKWVRSGERVTVQRFAAPIKNNSELEKKLANKRFLKLSESEGKAFLAQVSSESQVAYKPLPNGIWIVVRGVNFLENNPTYDAHLLEDKTLSVSGMSLGGGEIVHRHFVLIYVGADFTRVIEFALALRS